MNFRDPEDRVVPFDDWRAIQEKMLDKTIADSFPASDPPSSLPDPAEDSFLELSQLIKGEDVSMTMITTNIGLSETQRQGCSHILCVFLSDLFILSTKSRNYHWNVVGPRFNDLHGFFQKHYALLDQMMDDVAERIRALGSRAPGTVAEFLETAKLKEQPQTELGVDGMIADLLLAHEDVIRRLRIDARRCSDVFGDDGTADFVNSSLRGHEHMAWMLRSLLQNTERRVSQSAARSRSRPADQPMIRRIVFNRPA